MRSREVRIVWSSVRPATEMQMSILLNPSRMEGHTVSNAGEGRIREDAIFMVVGPVTCLVDEGGWKAVGEGLVVNEFRVDVVVDLFTVD